MSTQHKSLEDWNSEVMSQICDNFGEAQLDLIAEDKSLILTLVKALYFPQVETAP